MPKHIDWLWEQLEDYPGSKKRICITGAKQELTGHVVFPSWLNGLPVTDIGDRSFMNQRKLTAVTLPEGVVRIHPAAFDRCTALRKVKFPSTLRRLDTSAFRGCSALQEADIRHVDELFGETFLDCVSLRRVRLSDRLTKIPPRTFKGCHALAEINLPPRLTQIYDDAFDECHALPMALREPLATLGASLRGSCVGRWRDRKQRIVWQYLIRDGKVWLGGGTEDTPAILGSDSPDSVTLPKTIENLPVVGLSDYAFLNCTSIESLHGSRPLHSIGEAVFKGCVRLRSICLELDACDFIERDRVPHWGLYSASTSFEGCNALELVFLKGTGNTSLSFTGCENLLAVILPQGAHTLPSHAYSGCKNLLAIKLNATSCTLGPCVFDGCIKFRDIQFPDNMTSLPAGTFDGCRSLTQLALPTQLEEIGDSAFKDCVSLEKIVLPPNLRSIGREAFKGSALRRIKLPDTLEELGDSAFAKTKLTRITLPNLRGPRPTALPANLFKDCETLRFVDLPSDAIAIGNGCFANCRQLSRIKLPPTLQTIGDEAFFFCERLPALPLPKTLGRIGNRAFAYCVRLRHPRIPKGCTVEDEVFLGHGLAYRYDYVTNLYWLCETLPDGSLRLGGGIREAPALPPATTGAIKIPLALEGHPVSALAPYAFSGVALTSVTLPTPLACGEGLFENCPALRKVTLPDGMSVLPPSTFTGCAKLRAVRLPADLRIIGKEAFAWAGIRTLELPETVRTIGRMAFRHSGLVEIRIPPRVTCIRHGTFGDCHRLRRIALSPGLIAIGDYVFYRCQSLREVNFPDSLRGIGYGAFYGCKHFQLPPLPPNLTVLKSAALGSCITGGQVDIPASVRELPDNLFDGCQDLRILNVASRLTKISPSVLPSGAITRIFVAGREIYLANPS